MSIETEKEIVQKYTGQLKSREALAKEYRVPPSRIKSMLIRHGIPLRSRSAANTRFAKNESVFSVIDTEAKAYWLGFLYADGCITRNQMLVVGLSIVDHGLLKQLSILIYGVDRTRIYKKHGGFSNNTVVCQLSVSSPQIYNDLNRLGCFPRKTAILRFPTQDQVPQDLLCHFMRGYFDGDGCVVLSNRSSSLVSATVSFLSTKEFCEDALAYLKKEADLGGSIRDLSHYTTVIHRVDFVRNIDALRLYNLFYADATIFLRRKQEKFEQFLASHADRFHRTDWRARSWRDLGKSRYDSPPKC